MRYSDYKKSEGIPEDQKENLHCFVCGEKIKRGSMWSGSYGEHNHIMSICTDERCMAKLLHMVMESFLDLDWQRYDKDTQERLWELYTKKIFVEKQYRIRP